VTGIPDGENDCSASAVDWAARFELRGQEIAAGADRALALVQQCIDILTRSTADRAAAAAPPDGRTLG
jgi:hypothetical protein